MDRLKQITAVTLMLGMLGCDEASAPIVDAGPRPDAMVDAGQPPGYVPCVKWYGDPMWCKPACSDLSMLNDDYSRSCTWVDDAGVSRQCGWMHITASGGGCCVDHFTGSKLTQVDMYPCR